MSWLQAPSLFHTLFIAALCVQLLSVAESIDSHGKKKGYAKTKQTKTANAVMDGKQLAEFNAQAKKQAQSDFFALAVWLRNHGATVHPALKGSWEQQNGLKTRSIVADKDLMKYDEVLLSVPRKLWISRENFPDMWRAGLPKKACADFQDRFSQLEMRNAAALALEIRRGNMSRWHPWIKMLPKMQEFERFHPHFMSPALMAEWATLPVVISAKAEIDRRPQQKSCYEGWRKSIMSPVKRVPWKAFFHALTLVRTRGSAHTNPDGTMSYLAVVPGVDMLNTVSYYENAKGQSPIGADEPYVITLVKKTKKGEELYRNYCGFCNNEELMQRWGVYDEDVHNPAEIELIGTPGNARPNCSARVTSSRGASLQEITMDALVIKKGWYQNGWLAPRCPEENQKHQGPLRCSLARMAWEFCATTWARGLPTPKAPDSLLQEGQTEVHVDPSAKVMRRERPLHVHAA